MAFPSITRSRPCPVCKADQKAVLFRQQFAGLSDGALFDGYDLVVCQCCGMGFADKIPTQAVFDAYYAEMSKYEYAYADGKQTPADLKRFSDILDLAEPHLSKTMSLLDIGCATGGLLAEAKRRGFTKLRGVDPSKACSEATQRLYDIPAVQGTLADLAHWTSTYDAAFLTGVLEHVEDVSSALAQISHVLSPRGLLYFELPDATRYQDVFSAPYQLLSIEHINYFSPDSLKRLLASHGFECVFCRQIDRHLSSQAIEPTLAALFRKASGRAHSSATTADKGTLNALTQYLAKSAALDKTIHDKIDGLLSSETPIYVWGVGTHTQRLLMTSNLAKVKIKAFVDSNKNYQGKSMHGVNIIAPETVERGPAPILISSQVAEEAIRQTITTKLSLPNPVITLYT